jgi:hypothetical protein
MRRIESKPENIAKPAVAGGRRRIAPLAVFFVALVLVQSLALLSPRHLGAAFEVISAFSTSIDTNCVRHDAESAPGAPRRDACRMAGFCCLSGCDGRLSMGFAPTAAIEAPWTPTAYRAAETVLYAVGRIVRSGAADAWRSRAPPRAA